MVPKCGRRSPNRLATVVQRRSTCQEWILDRQVHGSTDYFQILRNGSGVLVAVRTDHHHRQGRRSSLLGLETTHHHTHLHRTYITSRLPKLAKS